MSKFILYAVPGGEVIVEVLFKKKMIWLTQQRMSQLFGVRKEKISKNLQRIFSLKELHENSVISVLEAAGGDDKNYQVKYYNLEVIISVGYRVNEIRAINFRRWATRLIESRRSFFRAVLFEGTLSRNLLIAFSNAVLAAIFPVLEKPHMNNFMRSDEYKIIDNHNKLIQNQCKKNALIMCEKYNKKQKLESEFNGQTGVKNCDIDNE